MEGKKLANLLYRHNTKFSRVKYRLYKVVAFASSNSSHTKLIPTSRLNDKAKDQIESLKK